MAIINGAYLIESFYLLPLLIVMGKCKLTEMSVITAGNYTFLSTATFYCHAGISQTFNMKIISI